jgi:hypothetical protein
LVGFLDISFNIHADKLWAPHWQPHLEFLTPTDTWNSIRKPLRKQLDTSASVKVPLLGVPVKNVSHQISYVFKPTATRKTDFTKTSPKARPHKQHLRGEQELELLAWLGLQPTRARTFMINVRAYGNRLVMLAGKGCHHGNSSK